MSESPHPQTSRWAAAAVVGCRLIVGSTLLAVGLTKIGSHAHLVAIVNAFEVVPRSLIDPVASILPVLEIAAGLLLILGLFARFAGALALVMAVVFFLGLIEAKIRGLHIDCGCSLTPDVRSLISWGDIVGALGFTVACGFVAWRPDGPIALDRLIFDREEEPSYGE